MTSQFQIHKCQSFLTALLIYSLAIGKLYAQQMTFKQVGLKEGLSEISVLAIEQDHMKRMWFGTRNGLNCWDGVQMKTFLPERGDSTSLMEHKIRDLLIDGPYLWVQTTKGLSRLDLQTFSFRRFYIEGILYVGKYNKSILVSTESGPLIYDALQETFIAQNTLFPKGEYISKFYQDQEGILWLVNGRNNRLIRIENEDQEVVRIPLQEPVGFINDMLKDSKGRLWITSENNGIIVYDTQQKTTDFITRDSTPFYLKGLSARSIVEDGNGKIWVGTFQGLAIFDLNENTTSFIGADQNRDQNLSHNSVYPLYISEGNNLWVGTYFGGVNYSVISNPIFTRYHNLIADANPAFYVIGSLIEDEKNNIWVAAEGAGLNYFDRKENSFVNYPLKNNRQDISQTNVKSLFLTHQGQLLIGTYKDGLSLFDVGKKKLEEFNSHQIENGPKHVNSIIKYGEVFLLATENGLVVFDLAHKHFRPFFEDESIRNQTDFTMSNVFRGSNGIIWMGSEFEGLLAYYPDTNQLDQYLYSEYDETSIAYNSINYITEDSQNRLWIGTDGGGLCLYNRQSDKFKTFNKKKDNLPSDFIYSIKESNSGDLWIATSKGLSYLDIQNMEFFHYEDKSGFPLPELNYKSLLISDSGEIFVGGINGLISFKEKELLLTPKDQNIIFTGLTVNNRAILAKGESNILAKDISVTESITLKPEHTTFEINFSNCNYDWTTKNKYQYKLAGFNENWVNAEYQTSAHYTNLSPGDYVFQVRATDTAYRPISSVSTIDILVEPPITQTWYAFTLYILVIFSLILLFNFFYISRMRLLYNLENERNEKQRIRELNLHKLRFFTNISHEFMTPLTIILSSLENIIDKVKTSTETSFLLKLAFRNAKRLKHLNRELLDFRKIEQGHLKIMFQEHDIVPYLNDVYEAFKEISQRKNVKYSFIKNAGSVPVYYDPSQMDKVFYNLLSNAFEHVAQDNGQITIQLINNVHDVEIKIIDNGMGIPTEKVGYIFDRFYQLESKFTDGDYSGSGIGLALTKNLVQAHHGEIMCDSELNNGTTITVRLQKGIEHINQDEISYETSNNQFSLDKELVVLSNQQDLETEYPSTKVLNTTNKPTLLVVEDNWEIRLIVTNIFRASYHVEIATDGHEGLEKAMELQPDIIISDVKMPRLSGLDMCKRLKRSINTSHIPIVLLTALGSEEDKILGLKYGADTYCTKPFSSKILKAHVENLFNNRKILQQSFNNDLKAETTRIAYNSVDQEFMRQSQQIIEQHISNPQFSVDEFAATMGLSRTLFYHKIKTLTGQTPNDFIQTIRLKNAANILLQDAGKNISEVAFDSGFSTPRYFSKCFKEHFGMSPKEYVKENKSTSL